MRVSHHHLFWAGSALLVLALFCLVVMDVLATWVGVLGMGVWLLPALAGVYLVMRARALRARMHTH